jgi:hypothetical protein
MNQPVSLFVNLSFISPIFLWIIWLLILLIFMIISWMLNYHWHYYGVEGNNKIFAKSLYFIGGIFLLVISAVFILSFSIFN